MSHHLKSEKKAMKNKLSGAVNKPVPVKIVNDAPSSSKDYKSEQDKWRAEDDLRALQRAEEIRADKARMKAAKSCAKEQMKNLKKVC